MEKKNQLMCAKDAKQSDLLIKKNEKVGLNSISPTFGLAILNSPYINYLGVYIT